MAEGDAAGSPHHHGSHVGLLRLDRPEPPSDLADSSASSTIDAIIVPTVRSAEYLDTAMELAAAARCLLVVLRSGQPDSAADVAELARERGIELVAIDTDKIDADKLRPHFLPNFRTTTVLREAELIDQRDTADKRNLGLLLAHLLDWRRVFFLDDDIVVDDPDDLGRAAELLDQYDVVGLKVADFPDNSVVCHINRETGGRQETFVGGGALAVNVSSSTSSFFPRVYNEDWLFLLGDNALRPTARVGHAKQETYDPISEKRARSEEFGDSFAEGLFWLLDDKNSKLDDADLLYWRSFIAHRRAFIAELLPRAGGSEELPPHEKRLMRATLRAALRRHEQIEPTVCVEYLAAWRADRQEWQKHLSWMYRKYRGSTGKDDQAEPVSVEKMLSELGLALHSSYVGRSVVPAAC